MLPSYCLLSKVPTKPTKQPLFGARHFVVGTGELLGSATSKGKKYELQNTKVAINEANKDVSEDNSKISMPRLNSPRGPQDAAIVYESSVVEDAVSNTSIDEDSTPSDTLPSCQRLDSLQFEESIQFQDPDLAVNYSEDLDFLAEKLLLQEEEHQNLVKRLQNVKEGIKHINQAFRPDYMAHAVASLGKNSKVSSKTVHQLLELEGEIKTMEAKIVSLSREILTAQANVAIGVTEVNSFSSKVAFKSERINALGLLNYGSVAKGMVSEINDAYIYCNLLGVWAEDLTKFNQNLCYEVSSLQTAIVEYNFHLRHLKDALCAFAYVPK
eukprot:TRINITY_DN4649_c0_g1_i1.p1 TRINITY_DN4649_c0_g1~~TRINITY_DN4649_c0_g1_i1.p1  ORF type:complete len:342 (+),score=22.92 TRINITY_DN4649_c0_g1_i1:51-1028(+)